MRFADHVVEIRGTPGKKLSSFKGVVTSSESEPLRNWENRFYLKIRNDETPEEVKEFRMDNAVHGLMVGEYVRVHYRSYDAGVNSIKGFELYDPMQKTLKMRSILDKNYSFVFERE